MTIKELLKTEQELEKLEGIKEYLERLEAQDEFLAKTTLEQMTKKRFQKRYRQLFNYQKV